MVSKVVVLAGVVHAVPTAEIEDIHFQALCKNLKLTVGALLPESDYEFAARERLSNLTNLPRVATATNGAVGADRTDDHACSVIKMRPQVQKKQDNHQYRTITSTPAGKQQSASGHFSINAKRQKHTTAGIR